MRLKIFLYLLIVLKLGIYLPSFYYLGRKPTVRNIWHYSKQYRLYSPNEGFLFCPKRRKTSAMLGRMEWWGAKQLLLKAMRGAMANRGAKGE
ncbi:hypothetical protein ABQD61_06935 [Enterococcus asini]|uniref:hypothetical protein n=1 Tax=Enterococcus asini TaxID=57732 RepID=UPI0032E41713